ncbi:MAG: tyrosine-type recombinase/integrase [Candidatus Limiplasma sp.]|nr:tyrosine-type recombinase/integrase [Candidatus Limiplasma sp.]
MGYYEKRGKNSWRIRERVRLNGRTRYVEDSLRFPASVPEADQLSQVEDALAELEADVRNGAIELPLEDLSLAQFARRYLDDYAIPSTSESNVRTLTNMLDKRILPALGSTPLRRLNGHQLQQFINSLSTAPKASSAIPPDQRAGHTRNPERLAAQMQAYNAALASAAARPDTLSARSVHQYAAYLTAMLSRAVKWGYLKSNPMDAVTPPKVRKRAAHFLDDDQAVDLLRKLAQEENLPFRAAVLLALLCGLRLGEVGALTFDDVDFKAGTIDISRALKYSPGAGSFVGYTKSDASERTVDLPDGMLVILEQARAYQEYSASVLGDRWRGVGRIVCNWDGSPQHHDTPSKQWRKFADKHGFVGVRFHDLRHSHATILLSNNVDVVSVASRLGHDNADITLKVYAHAVRKRDRTSADIMDAIITRANQKPEQP